MWPPYSDGNATRQYRVIGVVFYRHIRFTRLFFVTDTEHADMDLRDDHALLSEALAPHVADGHSASEPGVYALEIATPNAGHEEHSRLWLRRYDRVPPYLDKIVDADHVVYVGRSANVRRRISEHVSGEVRRASLPSVYDVRDVYGLRLGANTDHAERMYADELRRETPPETFVHTR